MISAAGDGATACYTAYKELQKEKAQLWFFYVILVKNNLQWKNNSKDSSK
jgi:phosphoribosyl-ATP pyrophosphohydrolase